MQCDKQKKPVIDITRGSKRKNIEDIVGQMLKVDKSVQSELFFMPWDFVLKTFKSDSIKRAELIEQELATDIEVRLDSLKNEMEVKNQAVIELIHSKFKEVSQLISSSGPILAKPPSYAGAVVAGGVQGQADQSGVQAGGGQVARLQVPSFNVTAPSDRGSFDHAQARGEPRERGRGQQGDDSHARNRSNSNKRRRVDDEEYSGGLRDRNQSQSSRQKKYVVGTSYQTGRKMRSPPADIFVYGVHPDTSPEDIVQDLACSDIIITAEDIVMKSREEAYLKSYKISVKAEDLSKALDPSVWPLRVKVREFIHYSRRPAAGGGQRHDGQANHRAQVGQQQVQQVGEQRGELPQFLAPNRYSLPGDNVPGGHQSV